MEEQDIKEAKRGVIYMMNFDMMLVSCVEWFIKANKS